MTEFEMAVMNTLERIAAAMEEQTLVCREIAKNHEQSLALSRASHETYVADFKRREKQDQAIATLHMIREVLR